MPLPLPYTLHYRLPERLRPLTLAGSRVRVQVGKRRMVGIVVAVNDRAPEGIELRDVDDLLDQRPVLTAELLRLGAFVADYYMSPIGETLRALVPARLPASGATRVRVTRRGAFLPTAEGPRARADRGAARRRRRHRGRSRRPVSRARGFAETLERLETRGLRRHRPSGEGSGARYRAAVELPGGRPRSAARSGRPLARRGAR